MAATSEPKPLPGWWWQHKVSHLLTRDVELWTFVPQRPGIRKRVDVFIVPLSRPDAYEWARYVSEN
jgi:hypothetical protein